METTLIQDVPVGKTLLTVDKLSVHFGDEGTPFRAVDRISYSVKQGEVVGIVGESGSGKSVSSLALMGLIDFPGKVMAEKLEFGGRDLKSMSEKELQQQENMALMLITHDLALVAEAAQHIIVMYAGQVVESAKATEIFRAPRHPYTQALLRSLPEFAADKARLQSLPGVVPGKYDRPDGCLLNPRCPYATDLCRKEEPALRDLANGRQSKCHYPLDDAGRPTL